MARILIADVKEGIDRLRLILHNKHDAIFATDFSAANAMLEQDLDAIICGLHFDDSRMLDFLTVVRLDSAKKSVPFICLQYFPSVLIDKATHSAYLAAALIGADICLDSKVMATMTDNDLLKVINELLERNASD